jgi:hypothetical protein
MGCDAYVVFQLFSSAVAEVLRVRLRFTHHSKRHHRHRSHHHHHLHRPRHCQYSKAKCYIFICVHIFSFIEVQNFNITPIATTTILKTGCVIIARPVKHFLAQHVATQHEVVTKEAIIVAREHAGFTLEGYSIITFENTTLPKPITA